MATRLSMRLTWKAVVMYLLPPLVSGVAVTLHSDALPKWVAGALWMVFVVSWTSPFLLLLAVSASTQKSHHDARIRWLRRRGILADPLDYVDLYQKRVSLYGDLSGQTNVAMAITLKAACEEILRDEEYEPARGALSRFLRRLNRTHPDLAVRWDEGLEQGRSERELLSELLGAVIAREAKEPPRRPSRS